MSKKILYLFIFIVFSPIIIVHSELVPMSKDIKNDDEVLKQIEPYRKEVKEKTEKNIGESEISMYKGIPEGVLGNLICDSIYENLKRRKHEVDLVFWNNRGIRGSLAKGPIKIENMFEVMPYENELFMVYIEGSKLKKIFSHILKKYGGEPISGMRILADKNKIKKITFKDKEFENKKVYKVVTSSYLVIDGWLEDFIDNERIDKLGLMSRDVVIDEFEHLTKNGQKISSKIDGRFVIK